VGVGAADLCGRCLFKDEKGGVGVTASAGAGAGASAGAGAGAGLPAFILSHFLSALRCFSTKLGSVPCRPH
jgi:hypothetical protein